MTCKLTAVSVAFLLLTNNVLGQGSRNDVPARSPHGRHNIQLNAGLLFNTEVDHEIGTGVTTEVSNDGFMGSIAYWNWTRQAVAVGLAISVVSSEVRSNVNGAVTTNETATVIPLLFGLKYQPEKIALSDELRGYFSASVGACFGIATRNQSGAVIRNEAFVESALASHFEIGTDWYISKLIKLGFGAGYYLITDFDRQVGSRENYSGPELNLSIGFHWGR